MAAVGSDGLASKTLLALHSILPEASESQYSLSVP